MDMTLGWGTMVMYPFKNWMTMNGAQYFWGLVAVFATSILFQFVFNWRYKLEKPLKKSISNKIGRRLIRSIIYGIQVFLAYLLMYFAMTYNWGVYLTIVFSNMLGYFIFHLEPEEYHFSPLAIQEECCH
eukprot:TRINITY_DN1013_c6_g1_i1.p1 TRINITY_DN1013_c6_g1~~TRINITY_DN1013_c6_g1_i1.p1  ORF type:complete len:129 (-),score=37.84 TRINITY_DN1013_c6_g1_i1:52-438(-)